MEVLKCAAMDLIMIARENPRCMSEMCDTLDRLKCKWAHDCEEDREAQSRWVESCRPYIFLKERIKEIYGEEDVPKKDEILQMASIVAEETKIPFPTKAKRTRKSIYEWLDANWEAILPTVRELKFSGA